MLLSETSYFRADAWHTHSHLWDDDGLCKKKGRVQKGTWHCLLGWLSKNTMLSSLICMVSTAFSRPCQADGIWFSTCFLVRSHSIHPLCSSSRAHCPPYSQRSECLENIKVLQILWEQVIRLRKKEAREWIKPWEKNLNGSRWLLDTKKNPPFT